RPGAVVVLTVAVEPTVEPAPGPGPGRAVIVLGRDGRRRLREEGRNGPSLGPVGHAVLPHQVVRPELAVCHQALQLRLGDGPTPALADAVKPVRIHECPRRKLRPFLTITPC